MLQLPGPASALGGKGPASERTARSPRTGALEAISFAFQPILSVIHNAWFRQEMPQSGLPNTGLLTFENGFKIGFNTRRPSRNRQRAQADAEHRINRVDRDTEFRNQQVAGSSPAGGSRSAALNQMLSSQGGTCGTTSSAPPEIALAAERPWEWTIHAGRSGK